MGFIKKWFQGKTTQTDELTPNRITDFNEQFSNSDDESEQLYILATGDDPFAPITLNVTLKAEIPTGFRCPKGEILGMYYDYDQSGLYLIERNIQRTAEFEFMDEGELHTKTSNISIPKLYAKGALHWNTVLTGIIPVDFFDAELRAGSKGGITANYEATTEVSYYDTISVEQFLGYGNPDTKYESNFIISVAYQNPYIVVDGVVIELKPVDLSAVALQSDKEGMQTIGYYEGDDNLNGNKNMQIFTPASIQIQEEAPFS